MYCEGCASERLRASQARHRVANRLAENAARRERYRANLEASRAKGREHAVRIRERDPEAAALKQWAIDLRSAWGITTEEYTRMLAAQCGVCAMCGEPESIIRNGKRMRLAVDHDHLTGRLRGLLCRGCNFNRVGRFEALLKDEQLQEYLLKWSTTEVEKTDMEFSVA